jgi:predicted dehydrogenase
MQRRAFLATAASAQRILGANDRVVVGVIGCGGRGRYVAGFMRQAGAEFGAMADVYLPNAEQARQSLGPEAKVFQDFRRLLEIKEIDAVLVATPDHWHAIPTILACQAGKNVYVEKPLGHTIKEGRAIVEAARRSKRIVQVGTQQRSATHFPEVARIIQSGELGDVRYVRVWNYVNMHPNGIGVEPDSDPPAGLDWDFYLGPAPKVPYNRKRFLGTYRWFFDYSGGYITDYGAHRFDTVHQIMGVDAAKTVSAAGGRFSLRHAGDVPDVLQVTYEYPGFVLSYEASNLNGHGMGGRTQGMRYYNARGDVDRPNGMAFYGTNGTLFADRIGFEIFPEPKSGRYFGGAGSGSDSGGYRIARRQMNVTDATSLHARHFVECVREQKKPNADAEIGHRSSIIPHLGNIAFKTGRKLRWDADKEQFTGDAEANKLLRREARKPWDMGVVI